MLFIYFTIPNFSRFLAEHQFLVFDIKNTQSIISEKTDTLSTEKQSKTIRQGSPRQNIDSENVHFDYCFDRVPLSPLSVGPNRFGFSANMDEASDLAERALTGEFFELPKKFPAKASKIPKRPAESSK